MSIEDIVKGSADVTENVELNVHVVETVEELVVLQVVMMGIDDAELANLSLVLGA